MSIIIQVANRYDRVRPSYTPNAVRAAITPIIEAYINAPTAAPVSLSLSNQGHNAGIESVAPTNITIPDIHLPVRMLDLGAGTGKFTIAMAERMYEVGPSVYLRICIIDV